MTLEELSNIELIQYYSMHWNQEQEHNAFGKLGGNMHSKALQEIEFEDTTKIKSSIKISNKINKLKSNLIQMNQELKRIESLKMSLTSKIKPKSKRTDNKIVKKQIRDYNNRTKNISNKIFETNDEINKLKKRLDKIPENPSKKKFKYGPVDYSISITNLANNLNSKLVEVATKGKDKFQLSTLIGSFYSISAEVFEDENNIYVEYFNIRQKKQINMVQNLSEYFNPKNIKLRGKTLNFSIKSEKPTGKIRNLVFQGL
jgi:hemerythrin superfamily protein